MSKIKQVVGSGFYFLILTSLCLTVLFTSVAFLASLFEVNMTAEWWAVPIITLTPSIALLPSLICKIITYYMAKNKGDNAYYNGFFSIFLIANIAIIICTTLIYSWISDYRRDYPEYYDEVDYRIDSPY